MSEVFIIIISCYRRCDSPINIVTCGGDSERNLLTDDDRLINWLVRPR